MKTLFLIQFLILFSSTLTKFGEVDLVSKAIGDIVKELSETYLIRFKLAIIGDEEVLMKIAENIIRHLKNPCVIQVHNNVSQTFSIFLNVPQLILSNRRYKSVFHDTEKANDSFNRYQAYRKSFIIEYNHSLRMSKDHVKFNSSQNFHNHNFYRIVRSIEIDWTLLMFNHVVFHSNSCISVFQCVNIFSLKSLDWALNSSSYVQEFHNFFNCEINVYISKMSKYSSFLIERTIHSENNITASGYYGQFLSYFSERCNFKIYYGHSEKTTKNKTFELAIIDMHNPLLEKSFSAHLSPPLYCYEFTFVVTKGLKYTPQEKLILPFDTPTWFLISSLFICGYFTIFIIYRLPLKFQKVVFGDKAINPSVNLILIFFGFGLNQVPKNYFARCILLMFLIYCLIIRTAYQGLMYEFMTTDTRKQTANTVQEIFDMNIPIIFSSREEIETFLL